MLPLSFLVQLQQEERSCRVKGNSTRHSRPCTGVTVQAPWQPHHGSVQPTLSHGASWGPYRQYGKGNVARESWEDRAEVPRSSPKCKADTVWRQEGGQCNNWKKSLRSLLAGWRMEKELPCRPPMWMKTTPRHSGLCTRQGRRVRRADRVSKAL